MAEQKLKALEIGSSGTRRMGGVIDEEYNSSLAFPYSVEKFDQMRRGDATVIAALKAMKLPIMAAKWTVEPFSSEKKDEEIAEFVEYALFEKIVFRDFLRHILMAFDFGFAVFEKVYTLEDSKIVYAKLAPRLQKSIQKWEIGGGQEGITQQAVKNGSFGTFEIQQEKLFHIAFDQEGDNFEGVSALRPAYKHWFFKENMYKLQAIGAERSGIGIPYAKIPEGVVLSDEDRQNIEITLENLRASEDAYVYSDRGIEFSFLTAGGGEFDFEPAILHHDRQISKAVLAQFLEIGVTKGGNAQSGEQQSLFYASLLGTSEFVAEKIRRDLIRELVELNFGTEANVPLLRVSDIDAESFTDFASSVERLSRTGIITSDIATENAIRKMLKLPAKEEEADQEKKSTSEAKKTNEKDVAKKTKERAKKEKEEMADIQHALTLSEEKIDTKAFEKFFDAEEGKVQAILEEHSERMQKKISAELEKKLKTGSSIIASDVLSGEVQDLAKDLEKELVQSYEFGKTQAAREMEKGGRVPTPEEAKKAMKEQAEIIAQKHADDLRNEAVLAVQAEARSKAESDDAVSVAQEAMAVKALKQLDYAIPILVSGGVNQGIGTVYQNFKDEIWGYQYSAVLDRKTSNLCKSLDGRIEREYGALPTPPLHGNCRSRVVAILKNQTEKPKDNPVPPEVRKAYEKSKWPYTLAKPVIDPTSDAGKVEKKIKKGRI